MATRLTTEEAYEASDCGEPILLNEADVIRICKRQDDGFNPDCAPEAFYAEHPQFARGAVDAAALLGWLGY